MDQQPAKCNCNTNLKCSIHFGAAIVSPLTAPAVDQPEQKCTHERLNEDGICRSCGEDCRGIHSWAAPAVSPDVPQDGCRFHAAPVEASPSSTSRRTVWLVEAFHEGKSEGYWRAPTKGEGGWRTDNAWAAKQYTESEAKEVAAALDYFPSPFRWSHWVATEHIFDGIDNHIREVKASPDVRPVNYERLHNKVMDLLRNTKMEHGLCDPRERRACSHCNAVEELDKITENYDAAPQDVMSANSMLDSIRASLIAYPNGGGDIVVMREVDRIINESCKDVLARIDTERDEWRYTLNRVISAAKGWHSEFNMYRSAWLREMGGTIRNKAHEIDGFVLRARDIYEAAKLVPDLEKRIKEQKAELDALRDQLSKGAK